MLIKIILIIALPVTGILGYALRAYFGRIKLNSAEARSHRIVQDALKEAENKRKELLIEAKDQLLKEKNVLEKKPERDDRSFRLLRRD